MRPADAHLSVINLPALSRQEDEDTDKNEDEGTMGKQKQRVGGLVIYRPRDGSSLAGILLGRSTEKTDEVRNAIIQPISPLFRNARGGGMHLHSIIPLRTQLYCIA